MLDVDIELDLEPRRVDVPPELRAALAAEPDLLRRFEGLSYSNQVRLAAPVAAAKSAETRQRRIDKACGPSASGIADAADAADGSQGGNKSVRNLIMTVISVVPAA